MPMLEPLRTAQRFNAGQMITGPVVFPPTGSAETTFEARLAPAATRYPRSCHYRGDAAARVCPSGTGQTHCTKCCLGRRRSYTGALHCENIALPANVAESESTGLVAYIPRTAVGNPSTAQSS